MLEEKIKKLGIHYIQNGVFNDYKWVKAYLPVNWELLGNSNDVGAERDETKPELVVFATNNKELGFSDVIDSIFGVIKHNEEKAEKDLLFVKYVEQLKNMFVANDITMLRNITFCFDEVKHKTKLKKSPTVKKQLLVENDDLTNSEVDLNKIIK
jgi:hypothetical protein